jgi:hypothetical protein
MKSLLAGLVIAATAAPAFADEVWSLPSGNQIVYQRDVGDIAVFTYRAEVGLEEGLIFVTGLGGNYDKRGTHQAYWVEADDTGPACAASIVDAEGKTWKRWGIAEVKFAKPSFPSKFTFSRGACFNAPKGKITAKPVIGAGVQ